MKQMANNKMARCCFTILDCLKCWVSETFLNFASLKRGSAEHEYQYFITLFAHQ